MINLLKLSVVYTQLQYHLSSLNVRSPVKLVSISESGSTGCPRWIKKHQQVAPGFHHHESLNLLSKANKVSGHCHTCCSNPSRRAATNNETVWPDEHVHGVLHPQLVKTCASAHLPSNHCPDWHIESHVLLYMQFLQTQFESLSSKTTCPSHLCHTSDYSTCIQSPPLHHSIEVCDQLSLIVSVTVSKACFSVMILIRKELHKAKHLGRVCVDAYILDGQCGRLVATCWASAGIFSPKSHTHMCQVTTIHLCKNFSDCQA